MPYKDLERKRTNAKEYTKRTKAMRDKYYQDNKEWLLKNNKDYYQKNKAKIALRGKIYNKNHKKQLQEYRKKWYAENKDKKRVNSRKNHLRKKYGISEVEYADLIVKQNGVCAICGKPPKVYFAIDHDHKTGEVRGLLCFQCNSILGLAYDDINILEKAIYYLRRRNDASGI